MNGKVWHLNGVGDVPGGLPLGDLAALPAVAVRVTSLGHILLRKHLDLLRRRLQAVRGNLETQGVQGVIRSHL